ncbi:acyl-CoA dehydrogenase family protein [Robertmurraya andreesenii]|uniref:Alkylation response protein AidB-like acyl-CoA dehydrogenase n=1 Tax=Anoxybacillus andreesenii TaxID=1325932 RepID=A0ABT9V1P9_9BACL|nr:acyl-CoA dehydrogenase family protein [Robertmurraya andreesenii]MDQ0154881.1 alkylation response protein AidB-like acyl-CoA dehydrogenase [Robertmurraya andreesenii]
MDLSFNEKQEEYRQHAREWLINNIPEGWGTPEFEWPDDEVERGRILRDWDRKLYEGGFAGIAWPKEYGGQGLTHVEDIIFNEEAGKLNAPGGINVLGKLLLGPTLLLFGTEDQKQRFLPPLLRGDEVWCQGFSEPNAGSDLAAIQTRAELVDDKWVINGQKVWTSFAHHADWCFVLARTDQELPPHKGITFFLVPMDSEGITVRPLVQINGNRDFNEVFFDHVSIPKENVVGGVNNGWKVAMGTLGFERGTLALGRQVRFQNEFNTMVKISESLKKNGESISQNSYYRQKMAELFAEIRILRYHGLKTISQLLNEGKLGPEASLQKLFWSTMHVNMGKIGLEILGEEGPYIGKESVGRGVLQEIDFGSRGETIYAGTTQIQKNIIAERVLGMPR